VAPAGGRASLRPGYNVVAADGQALRRLLEALFYPGPRDAETVPHASLVPGGAGVRVGVTLAGNDGVTYRLVRDLGGAAQLHRFDAGRRAFALVSQTLPEIAHFLATTVGVPPRGRFGALLSLSAGDLPSRQAGPGLRAGLPAPGPRKPLGPEEARKKLVELRAELARAQAADKLQYQLDGLQSRVFKLEEVIRAGDKIREGLASAEVALVEIQPLADVADRLGDVDARVAAFEKAASRRDEALAKLAEERGAGGEPAPEATPFWRRPEFWGGVAAGVGAIAVALAGTASGSGGLRYAALLDVPAFGYAGWIALRWVGELEGTEKAGRRRQRARSKRSGSAARRARCQAIASTSSTIHPVTPSSTISGAAPRAKASTGAPHSIDSIITRPKGSSHSMGKSVAGASASMATFGACAASPFQVTPGRARRGSTSWRK